MKHFILTLALSTSILFVQGQIHSGEKFSFQTNLLSFARSHPAVNISVHQNFDDRVRELSLDIGVGVVMRNAENITLNYFDAQVQAMPSLELTYGLRKTRYPKSKSYYSWNGSIGYLPFRHNQILCIEPEMVGSICRCAEVENREFNSYNMRAGFHYRIGSVIPLFGKHQKLDIWAQAGFFGYLRMGYNNAGVHEHCTRRLSLEDSRSTLRQMGSFGLFNHQTHFAPMLQFGMSYRFY
ncbi:MAG: hypothetical protein JJU02_12835 [Cryomorphaceae bacterium]|nr:hypothetical protein [Cryomorphaceae bacterium]